MSQSGKPQRRIYVGSAGEYLAKLAQAQDPQARLVDINNCDQYLSGCDQHDTTIYTSVADMPGAMDVLYQLLLSATEIVYVPDLAWKQQQQQRQIYDVQNSEQGMLESLLILVSRHRPVQGLHYIVRDPVVLDLVDGRCTDTPQLWAAGCSNTVALGVLPEQKWAQQLANLTHMPVSVLARGGASLCWTADQILRSDLRSGDILIWGLTNLHRQYFFHDNQLICLTSLWYKEHGRHAEWIYPSRLIAGEHPVYTSFQAIGQVKNFCEKVGVTLILFNTMPVDAELDQFLLDDPDYHVLDQNFTLDGRGQRSITYRDRGSDNAHPGPEQHRAWAEALARIIT